jgi:DNA-binding CsgD family transcriptional regulator
LSAPIDIQQLTLRVYDVVAEPSLLPAVLDDVADALRAEAASITSVDAHNLGLKGVWASGLIQDLYERPESVRLMGAERPLYRTLADLWSTQRFASDTELLQAYHQQGNPPLSLDELRAYLKERYGIHHRMFSPLNLTPMHHDLLSLHYSGAKKMVLRASMNAAAQLSPHLAKSLAVAQPLAALEVRYGTVLDALDRLKLAVVITGLDRRVWLTNDAAKRLLERRDSLSIDSGDRLVGSHASARDLLASTYARLQLASDGHDQLSFPLCLMREGLQRNAATTAKSGADATVVSVYAGDCSIIRHRAFGAGIASTGLLFILSDPETAGEVRLEHMEQLYGLTRAERAVCELLGRGCSNTGIADVRNVSPDTVASQVKAIFAKTRCKSRSELSHLIHRISIPVIE